MQYKNPDYVYLHPYKGCKPTRQQSTSPTQSVNSGSQKSDENFITKAWKGIKNFFLGLFGKNKDKVIEEIKAEGNNGATSFQDMQKKVLAKN